MSGKLRVRFSKDTHFDRIQASYFDDKLELTEKESDLKNRWKFAFASLLTLYSPQQTAKRLTQEFGVGIATAYRDVRNATALYGDVQDVDIRGVKVILREAYWRGYQEAIKAKDLEQQRRFLDSYKEMFDFDAKDVDESVKDKIAAHEYHIKIPRDVLKIIKANLTKGVIDFNDYSEDIDYTEVNDE